MTEETIWIVTMILSDAGLSVSRELKGTPAGSDVLAKALGGALVSLCLQITEDSDNCVQSSIVNHFSFLAEGVAEAANNMKRIPRMEAL